MVGICVQSKEKKTNQNRLQTIVFENGVEKQNSALQTKRIKSTLNTIMNKCENRACVVFTFTVTENRNAEISALYGAVVKFKHTHTVIENEDFIEKIHKLKVLVFQITLHD